MAVNGARKRDRHSLWHEIYATVTLLDVLRTEARAEYPGWLVSNLERLVAQAIAWQKAHPDYHPDRGYFDVRGVLELLRLARTLAREVEDANRRYAASTAMSQACHVTLIVVARFAVGPHAAALAGTFPTSRLTTRRSLRRLRPRYSRQPPAL